MRSSELLEYWEQLEGCRDKRRYDEMVKEDVIMVSIRKNNFILLSFLEI